MPDTATSQSASSDLQNASNGETPSDYMYTLNIGIHRFRAVAGSLVMGGVLVGVMLLFAHDGVQVDTFLSSQMDDAEQKQLLDKLNSISGGLAALLLKPLDVFLSMVITVAFLCLATKWSVYHENRRNYLVMVAIGVVGYLINTGFSALNMQVTSGKIRPVIVLVDLVADVYVMDNMQQLNANGSLGTTWDPKFRESAPGNSVRNTIMRSLFTGTEKVPSLCNSTKFYSSPYKKIIPSYGFPSRAWQQRLLSKALEPTVLSMPMAMATSDLPTDEDLPMNTSIVTNLAAYSLLVSDSFLGWWGIENDPWGSLNPAYKAAYKAGYKAGNQSAPLIMAEYLNLTKRSSQNATFVSDVHQVITNHYSKAENASTEDELAKIEFSHIDLSESVVFDALTIEIPTQKLVESHNGNLPPSDKTLFDFACSRDSCLVMTVEEYTAAGDQTTVYPRVQAFAICLNGEGEEDLVVDFDYHRPNEVLQSCNQRSERSMIVVSVGKRIEGDSFEDYPDYDSSMRMVNARMVYSLTVGRLSWMTDNLRDTFNATCGTGDLGCDGIRIQLEKEKNASTGDHLLVSNSFIPMSLLSPINLNVNWNYDSAVGATNWMLLASILEETRGAALTTETRIQPIVLPRNFKAINSNLTARMQGSEECERIVTDRLNLIERNHLYIEHTLQPAYTAGLYFIFQNAVVLKQLPSNATAFPEKPSLAFSGNIKEMHVQASIPTTSMWLAILGCIIMALTGIAIAVLGKRGERALLEFGTAGTTVEAISNRDKFPPFMLRLQLQDATTGEIVEASMDSLCVEKVVFANTTDKSRQFVVVGSQFSRLGRDQVKPYQAKVVVDVEVCDDGEPRSPQKVSSTEELL